MTGDTQDDVTLWWAPCARLDPDALGCWLTPEERARADRFRVEHGRVEFLAGRLLARIAIGRATGVDPGAVRFRVESSGRPVVAGPAGAAGTPFSISHGGGIALCAVAPGRIVGVDVEAADRSLPVRELAPRCLHPRERPAFDALPETRQLRALLEHWTAKEAYSKALGLGLAAGFECLHLVPERNQQMRVVHEAGDSRAVHLLRPALGERHLIAVVVDGEAPRLGVYEAGAWYGSR